ncbi:MAG: NAD-dependent epimerase/dehydratase family protein [Pseudoclavibacter sp.]
MRRVVVTGISGYVGGTVAMRLRERGYEVRGLVRREEAAVALERLGFGVIRATIQDAGALRAAADWGEAIVHTADSDDPAVAARLVAALRGTGKTLVYTSGSAIVANRARPETAAFVYADFPLETTDSTGFGARIAVNRSVQRAALQGVRSIVIVPGMVYGAGALLSRESKQIPLLVRTARRLGHAVQVEDGQRRWSTVHVDDLAELYLLALEGARPGELFFAENGTVSFRELALAIQRRLGFAGEPVSLSLAQATALWDEMTAATAMGSDCRIDATKARLQLGWRPAHASPLPYVG